MRHALRLVVITTFGFLLASATTAEPEHEAELENERMDQPPAPQAAHDNPLARSKALRVAVGPYVSIQVNVDALGQNIVGDAANEPSIAVNPANPNNMVIGWRQFDAITSNFRKAGWGYTFDKGETWTFPGSITNESRSDPVVDVDSIGNFFYQSLRSGGGTFECDIFKSTNGGVSWGPPVFAYGGDKNWMAVDRTGLEGEGHVYGTWTKFGTVYFPNNFNRSTDHGEYFEEPVAEHMSPFHGTMTVGPEGYVYITGGDGTTSMNRSVVVITVSQNAKYDTLIPSFRGRRIDLGGAIVSNGAANPAGLMGQGNVVTDHSTGPTRGNVYVLGSVYRAGSPDPVDVQVIRSTDRGQTWGAPVRVNDDASTTNVQWLAAPAVAPNGRIDVVWYDTRDSAVQTISRLYYAYSWDAGATWSPNVPVGPPFNSTIGWPNQNKLGDYNGIVSDATGADVAYAATYSGGQDVYYLRVFPDCNGNGLSDVTDIAGHTSFDCNLDHRPDECGAAPVCIGAGSVPESGTPLTVEKSPGDAVTLGWAPSCAADDGDYAVYEGSLGDFTSHAIVSCSTSAALSSTHAPAAGDRYFLVVPLHADREGSYGTDGAGAERPAAAVACVPQSLRACGTP